MKTIGDLVDAIKGFVYNNANYTDLFQGGTSSEDLETKLDLAIGVAINNARKWAERKHDFEFSYVDPSIMLGTGRKNLYDIEGNRIRTLKSVWYEGFPLDIITKRDLELRLLRKRHKRMSGLPLQVGNWPLVVVNGHGIEMYPKLDSDVEVTINGYKWLDDYVAAEYTDWLIENGFDFLMWQAIIELNHIVKIFVPRQEGNVPPPERLRDAAWESLIVCDNHGIAGGIWNG